MEVATEGGSFEKLQFKKCEDNYILDQHLRTCFSYLLLYIIKECNYLYKIKYNIIQNTLKTCTSQCKYSNLYNHKTLSYSQKWDDNIIYDIISNSNYFCNYFELFNEQNCFNENIHSTNYTKIKCLSSSTNLKEQNKYEEIPSYKSFDSTLIGGGVTVNHNLKNELPQIWDGIKPFLSPNEYYNNKKKDTTIVSFNINKENQLHTIKSFENIQNSENIFIDNNKQANKMATIMHNSNHSYVCKTDLGTFGKIIYEQPSKSLQCNHNEILNDRIVKDGDSVSEYKTFNNIDNINRFSKSCEYRDNSNRSNDGAQDSSEKNESEGDKEKEINNNENSNNSEKNNSNNNQDQNNNQNHGGGGEHNGEKGEDEENNNNNNGEDDKDKNDEDEEGENFKKEISEKEKYKFFYKKIKEIKSNIFVKRCKNVEKYFKKKIFNYINKNNIICNMNIDTIFIYLKNVYYLILNNKQLVFFFIYNTNDVMNAIVNTEKCNEINYSEKDFFLYFLTNEKEIYKKIFDEINLKYDKNELILKLKKLKKRLNDLKHTEETNLFEESMKQLGLFKDISKCVNTSSSNCQSNVSNEDIYKLFNYTNKRFLKNYKAVSHKLSLKNLLPKLYNCKDLKETNNLICNVGKNVKNVTKGGVGFDGKKKKKNKKNKEANMKKNNMNNSMINMNPYYNNFAKGPNMNAFMNNNIGNPQINNSFNYFRGFQNPQNNGFSNDNVNNYSRLYNNMQYAQHMQNNPNFKDNNLNDKDGNKNNETDEKGDENEVKKKTIRGITSFTLFAREKRKELLNQKVFLGSSLTEQTSAVAKIWNNLSDEKKKEWAVKASKINEENFLLQKKKKKRKFTAFSIFAREKRKEYKEKNIDMGLTLAQQNSYVSKLWKQLSTEEKNRYKYLSNTVNAAVAKNNKNQVNYINGQKVSGFKGRIKALDNMMSQHFSNNNNLMYNDMNNTSNFNNNNNNNNKMMYNQNQVMMGNEPNSYNMNYMANMQNIPQGDNNMNYFNYMENMNKNMPMGYMNNDMNMIPDNGDDKAKKNSLKKNKKKKNENFNDPNQLMNNPNYMLKNANSFNQQNYNSLPYHNDGLNNTNSYYPLPFPNDNNNEINNNTINNNSEMYRNIVINNNTQNMMTENNQNVMLNNMYDQNQISMNPNNIVNATTQINSMKNNMAINPDVPIINNAKGEHNMSINQIDNNELMQTHANVYINNGLNNANVNETSGMPNKINFPGHEHGEFAFNKFPNETNEMYERDNANIGGPPGSQTNMLMHNYQVMNGNPQNGAKMDDILKKKMMKDEKKKLKEEKMMLKEYDKRRKQMLKAEKLMEKNKNKKMLNGENNGMPIDSNSGYYDPANIMNNNNGNMAMYMNMNNYDISNPLINNPMINNYNFYANPDKQNINALNNTSTTISPRNNTNNTNNNGVISAPTDEVNNDEFSNYTYANKFMTDSGGVIRNNNSIPNDSNIQISDDIKKYDHVINNAIHDNTKLGNHIPDHQHIPNEQIQKTGINSSVINPNMPDNINHATYLNSNKDYFNNTSYFNNVIPNDQVMYQHTNGSTNAVNNGVPIKYLMENGANPNKIYGYNNNNYLNNINQNERTTNGISGGSTNAGVIIKNDEYFNTIAREKDNNNDIKVDQNFNNTNYYQPNSTNTYINPNTNRNGTNVIVGSVNMNNNNKMAHGSSSFSNDHVKNHNKINNSISYEVDDPNQGYANMNNPPVHLHTSKQHNQSQYINLNETINNDINMGINMEYNNGMNYMNINNDNNNNKNNNPAYFYPHNRNNNIPNGENIMYFPDHVVPENKMPGNLVYFDTDMNRVPGAMEDIEISGHKGKQFFNNASHFLELVDKKRIKRKKKKSSVNNVNGDNDTIWDLVLKNKSKRERRKNKKSNELTIDNTLEDIINSDQNPNDDLNLLCLNNNGYYLNTDQDKQMEENNDINELTNKERDEDADKADNENEDDILSLLNICMPNYSTKLNINERGEVTYDDKRTYNSNTIMNDNDNDFNFLMKTKNKVNENLNKCQIEKYNNAYKKAKLCKWSEQQTNKFYEVIEMFGVDLMMVRALLPSFTDKQIRDKYKKEKKNNPYRIDQALKKNKEIDLEAYENEHGKIDHSTHHNYYDSASDLDNSSPKKNNKDVDDSEINILSIFDNKDDDYNNNVKDQGEDKGITDFNILTLF
ncbi:high mobility group protein B3, putative [Plasmodium vinckei brucechwatti]|uniref:High mobility group protein B3, putative n=1 Tax=Plasmodium vinckei brucechwatti TaxID=119398 RepID=A0A6V7S043_PLAVN|nr:high mobility group protein B3, putative [Plasmodium vinckei brucechwatti]